jgi:hypothetical protein
LASRSGLAELAIWEGRCDDGRAIVDQVLGELERLDLGEEKPFDAAEICALGLRIEADCADLARAARTAAGAEQARGRAEPLLATLRAMTGPATHPQDAWTPCFAALGEAEWSRLQGHQDPQAWQRAAEHWERLELPYWAAYARFRQAEALLAARAPRAQIQPVLQAAHRTTVTLGAGPLRRETLVAAGRTNRQIGQALFITPKTASVHVSRILAKLGVAGRGEAAAVAHRLGLDQP